MVEKQLSSESQMDRGGNTISGLMFMCFCFSIVCLVGYVIFIDTNDLDWKLTQCRIIASEAGKPYVNSKGNSYCKISISYEYDFNGKKYISGRIDSYGLSLNSSDSQPTSQVGDYQLYSSEVCFVKNHGAGSSATCYVNPKKPELAVLFKGSSRVMLNICLVSAILAIISLAALIITLRKLSRA
ncbi:MAG: DUF3592 domain-containing protein [Vulcanimicrobiota bacterium]